MYLVSHALWSLVGGSTYFGAIANAATAVVDIGLVFPRENQTYAPKERFPIIFAIQSPEQAKHLQPEVDLDILNGTDILINGMSLKLEAANYSSEPYLLPVFLDFKIEGPLRLRWNLYWRSCNVNPGRDPGSSDDIISINRNHTGSFLVDFNIKEGAQKVDLVAVTAEEQQCPPDTGVAISVTDVTHDVPERLGQKLSGTCAVVASPTPTSNPCRVKIDQATVESMEAKEQTRRCARLIPPSYCPKKDQAIHQLAVVAGTGLVVALSAAAFLLV